MSTLAKVGLVIGGYLAAAALALLATTLFGAPASDQSGMAAFGDSMLFFGAFSLASTVPTMAALWFLRGVEWFWKLYSVSALVACSTALLSAIGFYALHNMTWSGFTVLRILMSPACGLFFGLSVFFAMPGFTRRALFVAAVVEACSFALVAASWVQSLLSSR